MQAVAVHSINQANSTAGFWQNNLCTANPPLVPAKAGTQGPSGDWIPAHKSDLSDLCHLKVPISGKPEIGCGDERRQTRGLPP